MKISRRSFLRTLGGVGVVYAASAIGLKSCDQVPDEALAGWAGPDPSLRDPRERALSWALLAPNPHNLQSWIADLRSPGKILLFVDSTRLLPETDPFGRQVVIGHGTFLETLVMALASEGYAAKVNLFPAGSSEGLKNIGDYPVAEVFLIPDTKMSIDPLFTQVPHRRSVKTPYDMSRPVAAGTENSLSGVVQSAEVRTAYALDGSLARQLKELTRKAIVKEIETPRTLGESIKWLRIGTEEIRANPDGIDLSGPYFWWMKTLGQFSREKAMTPGTMAYQGGLDYATGWAEATRSFGWIVTPGNSRQEQIAAGRAYMRLALKATSLGLSMHPVSQLLQEYPEMAQLQAEFLHAVGAGVRQRVQMLFRLGYADPVSPSPRRPLKAILRS